MDYLLELENGRYELVETVEYPNGGHSYFYADDSQAIIIDEDICKCETKEDVFPYSLITDKQNHYINTYARVFRFLKEDMDQIDGVIGEKPGTEVEYKTHVADREESLEVSPLELLFERNFSNVYGMVALKYLCREYGIGDRDGNNYFLDYVVHTNKGDRAVEENGVTYHHPQIIGADKYRRQLRKQNTCTACGIKLFRFSTDDCRFEDRIEDDIKVFFGENSGDFIEDGILASRGIKLYDHQEVTLEEIDKSRAEGVNTFLIVFPTASGKSKIVEEDLRKYADGRERFRALILAPTVNIVNDWKDRIAHSLGNIAEKIDVMTYAAMMTKYISLKPDNYTYIVIDEAHHAVSPVFKRVIQYFTPEFLIGLTATDQRPDKKKLEEVFGNYKTGLSLPEAMNKGIIAEANVYRIETNIDLSQVRFNGRDYVNADLEKSIRVTSRNDLIADVLEKYFTEGEAGERQGIIFCANTNHTVEMEKVLNERGISAKAYSGKVKHPEKVMEAFKNKEIRFLCACQMISEGWDYPELGIVVMARPTLSKVLYLQQVGRGLRRTESKKNVFVIDVVDEYGALAKPCSMHSIFANAVYVPFGNISRSNYAVGDIIEVCGLHETIEKIVEVDIETFEDKYGDYLNQEQLARNFYMSTGSVTAWIKKGRIIPDRSIKFGSRTIYLFAPESVEEIRKENGIKEHNDETIKEDFFEFLEERDYSLSYKMPFMLGLLNHINSIGDISIEEVLDDYIGFYKDRLERGLKVDRDTCPYDEEKLKDRSYIKSSMLTNPFEKFERKRFMYYSKDLGMISLNHALFSKLNKDDYVRIREQMLKDLENYYKNI